MRGERKRGKGREGERREGGEEEEARVCVVLGESGRPKRAPQHPRREGGSGSGKRQLPGSRLRRPGPTHAHTCHSWKAQYASEGGGRGVEEGGGGGVFSGEAGGRIFTHSHKKGPRGKGFQGLNHPTPPRIKPERACLEARIGPPDIADEDSGGALAGSRSDGEGEGPPAAAAAAAAAELSPVSLSLDTWPPPALGSPSGPAGRQKGARDAGGGLSASARAGGDAREREERRHTGGSEGTKKVTLESVIA